MCRRCSATSTSRTSRRGPLNGRGDSLGHGHLTNDEADNPTHPISAGTSSAADSTHDPHHRYEATKLGGDSPGFNCVRGNAFRSRCSHQHPHHLQRYQGYSPSSNISTSSASAETPVGMLSVLSDDTIVAPALVASSANSSSSRCRVSEEVPSSSAGPMNVEQCRVIALVGNLGVIVLGKTSCISAPLSDKISGGTVCTPRQPGVLSCTSGEKCGGERAKPLRPRDV